MAGAAKNRCPQRSTKRQSRPPPARSHTRTAPSPGPQALETRSLGTPEGPTTAKTQMRDKYSSSEVRVYVKSEGVELDASRRA